jgi:hypothetical protein
MHIESIETQPLRRFQDFQIGRRVPEDAFFRFEKTTQHLQGVPPSKAGNLVLDYLEKEIASSITKVNDKKYTIKADAFHNGLACQIKVYIYHQESGCAVEFQRRSGDSVAFWSIYEEVTQYLQKPCKVAEQHGINAFAKQPLPAEIVGQVTEEETLSILLQMPRQAPQSQDELASRIFSLVEETLPSPAQWCKLELLEVLIELLASNRFAAAYPAACSLAHLANTCEARRLFFNQRILKSIVDRLWVKETGEAVWLQLAHVMHSLAASHADYLDTHQSQELADAIAAGLDSAPGHNQDPHQVSDRAASVALLLRQASLRSLLHMGD